MNVPDGLTSLGLSVLILLFAILKALTDDAVHWPAWLGVILAAGIGYGAWLVFQASGESLPSMSSAGSSTSSTPPPADIAGRDARQRPALTSWSSGRRASGGR